MKFKEYVKKYYSEFYDDINDTGNFAIVKGVIFPSASQLPSSLKSLIDYEPFDFSSEYANGGYFAEQVAFYLGFNFWENEINTFFENDKAGTMSKSSKMQLATARIVEKNRYKWHGLWNTTQVDSQYDMLDNVNEIFDETTKRVPNLTKTENVNNEYGAVVKNDTNNVGEKNKSSQLNFGERGINTLNSFDEVTKTTTDSVSARTDLESQANGYVNNHSLKTHELLSDKNTTTNGYKYPFDDATVGKQIDKQTIKEDTWSDEDVTDSDTSIVNNDVVKNYGSQKVTSAENTPQHSESSVVVESAKNDIVNEREEARVDSFASETKTHNDKMSGVSYEGGDEETTITRRRHGNIGVTTSGQLIEDYRKTHNFDLVKIVGDDIANELFSQVWG